ncbi:hypothetical protein JYK21_02905 [Ralstonia pickettii]|nr:hypothetical protein [Ralstonia pickettii]
MRQIIWYTWAALAVLYVMVSLVSFGTGAYFTSETSSNGSLHNATTKELISIQPQAISMGADGIVSIKMTIANQSDVSIPINFENVRTVIKPDETISEIVHVMADTELSSASIRIVGFHHYIDELVWIPLNKQQLLEIDKSHAEAKEEIDKAVSEVEQKSGKELVQNVKEPLPEEGLENEEQEGTNQ